MTTTDFVECILSEINTLPQIELYPERKIFVLTMKGECKDTFINLVTILSNKYCTLYKDLKGKDAYIKKEEYDFLGISLLGLFIDSMVRSSTQLSSIAS